MSATSTAADSSLIIPVDDREQNADEVRTHRPSRTSPGPGGESTSIEGVLQVVIMLAIGTAAGAGSFTHVHDVAAAHGQAGWLAWADAVVLELMSIASG